MSKKDKDAETPRETFNLRAKPGQVIPYSEADDELRARMKKSMAEIKEKPDSFEALIGYGSRPMAKMGRAANRMVRLQEKFNTVAQDMARELNALDASLKSLRADRFAQATVDVLNALAKPGKTLKANAPEIKAVQDGMRTLPALADKIGTITTALENSNQQLDQLLDEARRINRQRRDAAREIGIAIGAGEKLSEKFENKFLKKAVKRAKKDWNEENKQRLKDIIKRGGQFKDRLAVLEAARAASTLARRQLGAVAGIIQDQRAKITEITEVSAKEWKAMLGAAGQAAPKKRAPRP